jgi:sulfonate transport system ATP-binding protein
MLDVRNLSKVYANGTHALDHFSLTVGAGEVVAVIGGSGCGKSTLLRLLCGLEVPSQGEIRLQRKRLEEPDPLVNIVFQEPRLFPWLTVADNIGFGLSSLDAAQRQARVVEVLHRIGLAGYEKRWIKELSGGQAQRVALARALLTKPAVLLLDEPFSALDAMIRADLQDHLVDLWSEAGSTMVLVTHDIEEAIIMADRIVVMRPFPGRIFKEVAVDLPRRRERTSSEFAALRKHLSNLLTQSLTDTQRHHTA